MTTLARKTSLLFGSTATDIGQFGSAAASAPALSTDPAVIQSLSEWGGGWLSATLGANKFPAVEDMNAVDYVNSYQATYLLQEGMAEYDAGTNYSQYAMCKNPGTFQIYGSLAANNIGHALSDGAHWQLLIDLSQTGNFSTGDVKMTLKTAADSGWIMANDLTIGNAGSGAYYQNANAAALYALLWNNVSNTYAPVTGGRGANAAADFAAGKPIHLTAMLGRALCVAGTGSGGNATAHALGSSLGDEALSNHNHTLNDPTHTHGLVNGGGICSNAGGYTIQTPAAGSQHYNIPGDSIAANSTGITINSAGAGTSGNMQPSSFLNVMIKL